jgi:probable addiction module antidote protein
MKKPKTTKVTYSTFDVSDYLNNETVISEYLSLAAQDENPEVLILALSHVAKARGMAQVAKDAGLGRESLYKALRQGSKPRFETIAAIMRALDVKIAVAAKEIEQTKTMAKTKRPQPTRFEGRDKSKGRTLKAA